MDEEIKTLKSSLRRIAMVRDWCGSTGLLNVHADMTAAIREIESVIYKLQAKSKAQTPDGHTTTPQTGGENV